MTPPIREAVPATNDAGKPAPSPAEPLPPAEPAAADPRSIIAEPTDEAAHVFDPALLHTFDVGIAAADLQTVDANPAAEQYVPARVRFEGQTYDAGYRYKGSLGAFFPPCTDFLTQVKQGKCSIKLSFNWMNPDGRFFGLKKLLFHAMNNDPSLLRERLGYALFREMGVPAPRASHAVLRVNGKAELYALVEEVDGRFTRSRFVEGGKGNLYKEIWPVHDDTAAYVAALETNDAQPNVERIQRFRRAVEQGPEAMAAWLDVDVTTSYMAVDRVILNDDGAFHFYCFERAIGNNPKAPGNHNYYWYEAAQTDRVWIIPWDLDMAMNDSGQPPHIEVDWRAPADAAQCDVCAGSALGAGSPPPGCDRVIQGFRAYRAMYDAKVDRFVAGPFSKAAVDQRLRRWQQQLASAGYTVPAEAFDQLTQVLDRARLNRGFRYP
ncbi:MAG TPA: CotH kinase family protein [Polyangiales bacterium]|nr:CotH kinase family protein [Polyangiales bacterium]